MELKPEEIEARLLAEYLDTLKRQKKILVFTHVSNETFTKSWMTKNRNKAMGVRAGTPDYILVTKEKVIFLELKRKEGGVLSKYQKEWLEALGGQTVVSTVQKGFDNAKEFIDQELKK